ncbi:MAG: tRNA (adenosine(37)-N6)-threonylcarbamoyltransferase complex dimerization subunit type 1 TsaB [Bacteroidota bacterium]
MALILQIDTATEHASICLSKDGKSLHQLVSADQKNHGSFLQPAIQELMQVTGYTLKELDAIAVTEGPGSYTGLRVGLASAKGLCYALDKPLITINTLKLIAVSAINEQALVASDYWFVPMIDARRMEVFTAIYNSQLALIETPSAKILDEHSFQLELEKKLLIFCGSGSAKFKAICQHPRAHFTTVQHDASDMSVLAFNDLISKTFANLAYCEPFYLKSFYSPPSKK